MSHFHVRFCFSLTNITTLYIVLHIVIFWIFTKKYYLLAGIYFYQSFKNKNPPDQLIYKDACKSEILIHYLKYICLQTLQINQFYSFWKHYYITCWYVCFLTLHINSLSLWLLRILGVLDALNLELVLVKKYLSCKYWDCCIGSLHVPCWWVNCIHNYPMTYDPLTFDYLYVHLLWERDMLIDSFKSCMRQINMMPKCPVLDMHND